MITVEDISPNLGCYGDNKAHTPTLDGLAAKGFKYINAIANAQLVFLLEIDNYWNVSFLSWYIRHEIFSKPWMKDSGCQTMY